MTSHAQHYLSGRHEEVWADLGALGQVPDHLREDVREVADLTMARVAAHVSRLAESLPELGFEPSGGFPFHTPPGPDARAETAALAEEIGGVPAALAAYLSTVGEVGLTGDWPEIGLHYHSVPTWTEETDFSPVTGSPDPLCLPGIDHLRFWVEECLRAPDEDEGVPGAEDTRNTIARTRPVSAVTSFDLAPDELHKANVSGGTHDVLLPDASADPVLIGVRGRPGVTLVEYLRAVVAHGGFPGWELNGLPLPEPLRALAAAPDF
ncbi:hypothetical protein GCM10007079_09820 [Nocardiopsis terrae]|uniref:Mycothiol maleylpyruvate isomerase N-terminal domain-containing protein n=1 Tax=Nocardiopsis terrae TaxID=372655 RepID=A0ABR9HCN7_9ACTN|nr:hypothetical protein [Nocardiopsis terrae]MBE1456803.1 hypothetical protein [Nocardiopsis terrae]GHC75042.1 hypothetical protein GCM10007079_09820 [Nocardiopsis terrae]